MEKKKIPIEDLGRAYGIAVERMFEAITNHSEDLYTQDGSPRQDPGHISRVVDAMITTLRHEASLIRDASYEFWEANADTGQEELF